MNDLDLAGRLRCNAMRTTKRVDVLPGKWKTWRCRNRATRSCVVFNPTYHPRIADNWFRVYVCDRCWKRGEADAD